MVFMTVMAIITFLLTNIQALVWQSSEWLVGTVLPAVIVDLTNYKRSEFEVVPLQRNAILDEAARLKAEHMAKNEYFSHYSPEGISPWYWYDEVGYVYAYAGENLAIHFTDSSAVVEAWMKSPKHKENIINNHYTEIGIGTAKGQFEGYDTVYVVQLFATPGVLPVEDKLMETKEMTDEVVISEPEIISPNLKSTFDNDFNVTNSVLESSNELSLVQSDLTEVEEEIIESIIAEEIITPSPVVENNNSKIILDSNKYSSLNDLDQVKISANHEYDKKSTVTQLNFMSTSSGLTVANLTIDSGSHAGGTITTLATRPHLILQSVYVVLGGLIITMLTLSILWEARRYQYVRVLHSFLILLSLGVLWYVHNLLTIGVVV